jgi:hypothetical protein
MTSSQADALLAVDEHFIKVNDDYTRCRLLADALFPGYPLDAALFMTPVTFHPDDTETAREVTRDVDSTRPDQSHYALFASSDEIDDWFWLGKSVDTGISFPSSPWPTSSSFMFPGQPPSPLLGSPKLDSLSFKNLAAEDLAFSTGGSSHTTKASGHPPDPTTNSENDTVDGGYEPAIPRTKASPYEYETDSEEGEDASSSSKKPRRRR